MNADFDIGASREQSGDSIEGVASKPVAADAHTTHDIRQQGLGGVVEDVEMLIRRYPLQASCLGPLGCGYLLSRARPNWKDTHMENPIRHRSPHCCRVSRRCAVTHRPDSPPGP